MGKRVLTPDNRPVKKKTAGRIIINFVIVILVCVFLYSGYRVYDILTVYKENEKLQTQLQGVFHEQDSRFEQIVSDVEDMEVQSNETELPNVVMENPLGTMQEINEDVIAWIQMEDTVIDYPVVQGDDNDYYLNHDIYGNYTACGSIFMDARNDMELPMENIILYGHRMNDDSMFGELIRFTDEKFFNEHPTFRLITETQFLQCEIFAVYQTTTDFEYYRVKFEDAGEFFSYIDACKAESLYQRDVEIAAEDRILTLSTCDTSVDVNKGRLVVQAKLTPLASIQQGE